MSIYVMVKRKIKSPYTHPDMHALYIQFKSSMSTAFNMVNSRVGWERQKRRL